ADRDRHAASRRRGGGRLPARPRRPGARAGRPRCGRRAGRAVERAERVRGGATMSTTFHRGALLALAIALVSGVSVYVAKLGTQAVLAASGRGARLSAPRRGEWARLGLLALVGGSVPFLLFFWGLTMTSAPTASFIQKTQFLWVSGLAVPLLGEALGAWQALGLLALLAGTLVMGPAPTGFGPGEGLVLAATLLWSVEVVLARGLLRRVPPTLGALARMGGGAVVMLAFLGASGRLGELFALDAGQ